MGTTNKIIKTMKNDKSYWLSISEKINGFKPCGEGDNICNCKSKSECGYIEIAIEIEKLQMKLWEEENENLLYIQRKLSVI